MKNKNISQIDLRMLISKARLARTNAYAPYSGFAVGAAVLTQEGKIFAGANMENSSYGLSNCAERSAIQKSVNAGYTQFKAIAIVADTDKPCPPCGACRQVIYEFGDKIVVVMSNLKGITATKMIATLLPFGFRLKP